jgi:PAS domain S-box-containing protein
MQDLGDFFRRIPVALYRTTPGGTLVAGNPALAAIFGFESMAEMERELAQVEDLYIDPHRRQLWLDKIAAEGAVHEFDVELRRVDGSTLWVQDTARAVRDERGEILYYDGALIDVTGKMEARKSRDEFLASVSHELRTPITVVVGLGEELATGYESFSDEERRELAVLIARQAEDASWILDDLLVAYRNDVSEMAFQTEKFDLVKAAERVLEVLDQPITVEVDGSRTSADADPRRTRQIVRNLINNALRYGGENVVVRIASAGDRVELAVCDDGDPISEEDVERIFRPFERGGAPGLPNSVGLGLPVARKLARLMNGDLVYRHTGVMSCFILSLPSA